MIICLGMVFFDRLWFWLRQIKGSALTTGGHDEYHGGQQQLGFYFWLDSGHVLMSLSGLIHDTS